MPRYPPRVPRKFEPELQFQLALQQRRNRRAALRRHQRLPERLMHNAPRQPRENTHMLIPRRMLIERQHNHKLRLIVAPRHRLRQTGDADGRLLNMLRFTVRNGEAKP